MRSCLCRGRAVWDSLVFALPQQLTIDKAWSRPSSSSAARTFREGDGVTLRYKKRDKFASFFVPHLSSGQVEHTHHGPISHNDIIGKTAGQLFFNRKGISFRACEVNLADWVQGTARDVTPIYPGEANNIVHHLDIHPVDEDEPPLEILEAGTGHGSLTLHLARAIYGFNAVSEKNKPGSPDSKSHRRAVIHSVEVKPNLASRARKVVKGFRNGIYAGDVDFHVADVGQFVRNESAKRLELGSSPRFLSHAVLDLPDEHSHLPSVVSAMRDNALLAVFTPNVNKLVDCLKAVKYHRLPLRYENTFELGANHSAGKPWKVEVFQEKGHSRARASSTGRQAVHTYPSSTEFSEAVHSETGQIEDDLTAGGLCEGHRSALKSESSSSDAVEWRVICRPDTGYTVTGGGFLGLFRRFAMRDPLPKVTDDAVSISVAYDEVVGTNTDVVTPGSRDSLVSDSKNILSLDA